MTSFAEFGDPTRFQIALRWLPDSEPRQRRPAESGWSTGELRLTVREHVLTLHDYEDESFAGVRWYLIPFFEWIGKNWVSLLHEERFAWRENSPAPAATAAFFALRRFIGSEIEWEQSIYTAIQQWWSRHALRAADAGALFPDVLLRRLGDDIEVSWTARQPHHKPDGFRFTLTPGAATLSVPDVAGPLWEALVWVANGRPEIQSSEDRRSVSRLKGRIAKLTALPNAELEAGYLPSRLFKQILLLRDERSLGDTGCRMESVPAITRMDDAVLMFGGVSPDLGVSDVNVLTNFLAAHAHGAESNELKSLVDPSIGAPLTAPFEEGYDLAEQLLDTLRLPGEGAAVDIRGALSKLGVRVEERALVTAAIRGVAVAGANYAPSILINSTSPYNQLESGRRFTLAHELFHILYDRTRARRLAHVSGAWAPAGIEKRANAFAAMLLMPRDLVGRILGRGPFTWDQVVAAANSMQVGVSALVEHLYNTDLIDDFERDSLRIQARGSLV